MEDTAVLEKKSEKSVSSDLIRGHINTIILRALYDGDKYGYEIIAEIERKSHGQYSLKQPSLYSALKRLETDGYITSYWGGSVGGGRRKYFSLTESGKAISEQNQSEWEYSRTVIDSLISDKDFDFSNPAPTMVNMRVLKETTSRVPRGEGSDELLDYEPSFDDSEELGRLEELRKQQLAELEARRAELDAREQRLEEEIRARNDAAMRERDWRESEIAAREQALAAKREELEALRASQSAQQQREADEQAEELRIRISTLEEELHSREEALESERSINESELEALRSENEAELDRLHRENEAELAALKQQHEEELARVRNESETIINEVRAHSAAQAEADRVLIEQVREEERRYSDIRLNQTLAAEREQHVRELNEQAERIVAEQEELFRKREQQLLHRNYLDLVNTPPAEEQPHDYNYFSVPQAEQGEDTIMTEDYRSVVHRLYANAVSGESTPAAESNAQSLDGIDFTDLETRAARDGIRIQTAGSPISHRTDGSESLVHKGRALFVSGVVTFLFCVALGSVLLGLAPSASIPVFYPYLIWSIGLAVLLVTGLAYANHYGEQALRRTGPVILNVVVSYILLTIVTLIAALSARADLNDPVQVTSWITIPFIALLGIVLFGVVYYLQVRPKKEKSL